MIPHRLRFALASSLALLAVPASAQFGGSEGYKFLQAIKDSKPDEITKALEQPGVTLINTRDASTGDGALHIVTRRGDATYLGYLLGKDADPNLKNFKGETALLIAANTGRTDLVETLARYHANVNLGTASGETPLIVAVHRRDLTMIRSLLALGADPDQKDLLGGFSARDYAQQDTRSPTIAQLIEATPKKQRRAVSGPKL